MRFGRRRLRAGTGVAAVLGTAALLAGCVPVSALGAGSGPTATVPAPRTAATSSPISGWLHTSGARIVDASNHVVTIKAANWFGMETSNCAPHGLWTISLTSALTQIRSFGFNTIRLPFANQCLDRGATTSGIDFNQNPSLAGKSPLQVMDAVVATAGQLGLKVILDRHRPDTGAQSALWYTAQYSEARWISDWKLLASRYKGNSSVIGADLHNEPHANACWGCGDPSRDWEAAATRAGNAVLSVNPHLLVVVEGIEQQGNGTSTWWGGGLADVRTHPLRLARAGQLVYSAHDYPASVYGQKWFSAPNYPNNLTSVWDSNWGYLATSGTAPVFLGEFGTKLETTSDKQWLTTLVGYLQRTGISFGYWSYNPNSGDTGGLVADDWRTPQTAKLNALKPILGAPIAGPTPKPAPAPTPTPTPTPAPGSTTSAGVTVSWQLQSSWQSGPGAYGYVAQLVVGAPAAHGGWSVSWADPGARSVTSAWGMTCSVGSGKVSCTGADYGRSLSPGQPLNVGLQIGGATAGPAHPALTVSAR